MCRSGAPFQARTKDVVLFLAYAAAIGALTLAVGPLFRLVTGRPAAR